MAARQRAGCVSLLGPRDVNEDRMHVSDHSRTFGSVSALLAVADGMGGLRGGDIASQTAIDIVVGDSPTVLTGGDLAERMALADLRINEFAQGEDRGPMGTTLTTALVEKEQATVAHIGDSRAYIVHNDTIRLITEDHSRVGRLVREGVITEHQAMHHPEQNVLERALGTGESMPDIYRVGVGPGDILFLCTDGLHTFVTAEEIRAELASNVSLQAACERLAVMAEQRGSSDNITAVAWEYPGPVSDEGGPTVRPTTVVTRPDVALTAAPAGRIPALVACMLALYLGGFVLGWALAVVVP